MHVGVVAIPGTFASSFTSVLDILRVAEALRPDVDRGIPPISTTVVGARPSVRAGGGVAVDTERALTDSMDDLDVLVVPTLGVLTAAELERSLAMPEVRELSAALRDGPPMAVPTLAGACTGTFVLAEAGRLEGVRATTCWWLSGAFELRYPGISLDQTRMIVRSDGVITAGAAFAHIDLAVSLVAEVSERLAETVARHMLVDERPARSIQALLGHLSATDAMVTQFEDEVRARIAEPIAIPEIADALGVTRRTLERHVRQRTGRTPGQLVQRLRAQQAQHLRRTTELSMDQIAGRVGYASAITLRRALDRIG